MAIQSKQRVREIFNEASELAAEDRPGYLDKACGDDAKLRAQVEALINALSQAQQAAFLGQPSQVKGVAGGAGGGGEHPQERSASGDRHGHRSLQDPATDRRGRLRHGVHGRAGKARPAARSEACVTRRVSWPSMRTAPSSTS